MPLDDPLDLALARDIRLRDAGGLVGMSTRQIVHAGQTKLQLPDWRTGKGNYRRFSVAELFELRVVSAVDQRVPIPALQPLADLARGYFRLALTNADFRRKPAIALGYPGPTGAWWWLLAVDGQWPDNPPPPAANAEFMVLVRIREALAGLMLGWVQHLEKEIADTAGQESPAAVLARAIAAEAASSPADDLRHAATVLAQAVKPLAA